MKTYPVLAALVGLSTLSACGSEPAAETNTTGNAPITSEAVEASPPASVPALSPTPGTRPDASVPANTATPVPDRSPPALVPESERGEKGARNLLLEFARSIELKRFGQAYDLLSPADRKRWSRADFAAIFKDLGKLTVAVPTGTLEGAAGSSYYTAPVTITGNDKDGRPVRIEGEAILRRVNDVPGATAAQLRWHFDKLTLDWTH